MNTITTKTCKICGESKQLSEFSPHKDCKFKVRPRCKKCEAKSSNTYYWKDPAKKIAQVKKWQSAQKTLDKTPVN